MNEIMATALLLTNTTNSSGSSFQTSLRHVNDSRAEALIPAMVVLGVLMVVGGVGNSLVCYVIGFKLKRTPQNLLIVCLAVLDLCSCVVSIPTDIVDMRFSYMFPSQAMCKGLRFVMYFTSMGSGMTLIAIAVDRYRKICRPLGRQMSLKLAILAATLALLMALLLAWPAALLFGLRTINTNAQGVSGHDCSTSDKMKDTIFPLAYTLVLFSLFFVSCFSIAVLYCLILCATKRHRHNVLLRSLSVQTNHLISHTPSANGAGAEPIEFLPLEDLHSKDENLLSSSVSSCQEPSDSGDLLITLNETDSASSSANGERTIFENRSANTEGYFPESYKHMADESSVRSLKLETMNGIYLRPHLNSDQNSSVTTSENAVSKSTRVYNFSSDVLLIDRENPQRSDSELSVSSLEGNRTRADAITERTHRKGQGHRSRRQKIERNRLSIYTISSQRPERYGRKASDTARQINQRTTLIAFLVSLVFILSYLPYLSLQVAKLMIEGFDYDQEGAALVLYNIFLRSYYTNSIANPVIYGVLNVRFKEEVCSLFFRDFRKLSGLFMCKTDWR